MNKTNDIFNYIRQKYNVTPEYPFKDDNAVFRHNNNKKWFGITICNLPIRRLNVDSDELCTILNVKCEPTLILNIVDNKNIFPAYHMNKKHWISILLDDNLDNNLLTSLIDISYDLTAKR